MPPVRSERLLLRSFLGDPEARDAEALFEALSDPAVVRFEAYPPFTKAQAADEVLRRAQDDRFIAVCLPPDADFPFGRQIGALFFCPDDFGTWELGYVFARRYWHRGYASEAVRTLFREAFSRGEVRRITAMCNPDNTASWHLMERVGMRREGRLVKNMAVRRDADGSPVWQDTFLYAILKEECTETGN